MGSDDPKGFATGAVAAIAILIGGAVHLKLYDDAYRDVPNYMLGRSFLANVAASGLVVVLLMQWTAKWRFATGLALAAGTLGAFVRSRIGHGIFGFSEHGLQPSPEALIALVAELVAVAACLYGLARRTWDEQKTRLSSKRVGRIEHLETSAPSDESETGHVATTRRRAQFARCTDG